MVIDLIGHVIGVCLGEETVSSLISGEAVEVRTDRFENDFETFRSRDDVLTLLIHLGYLTWNEEGTAHIPNEEVRLEFRKILEGTDVNTKWLELIGRFQKLLEAPSGARRRWRRPSRRSA